VEIIYLFCSSSVSCVMLFGLAELELNMDWMCVVLYVVLISQEPFG
jgi:hypothetical protein